MNRLVIFDCDGVLVNSEPLVNRVYVDLMRERGFEIDEAESLRSYAGTHMPVRLAGYGSKLHWTPDAGFAPAFHARLAQLLPVELTAVPGVEDLLQRMLTRGLSVCAASNGTKTEIEQRLKITKLDRYFDGNVFSAVDLDAPKPSPRVFVRAAESFGVEQQHCIVIEDSVTGVQGAVAAGMKVFGYAALADAGSLSKLGATVFDSMHQLIEILQL